MKKTYISPTFVAVVLRCNKMIAESYGIYNANTASGPWVKEENTLNTNNSTVSDVNVWDNEW